MCRHARLDGITLVLVDKLLDGKLHAVLGDDGELLSAEIAADQVLHLDSRPSWLGGAEVGRVVFLVDVHLRRRIDRDLLLGGAELALDEVHHVFRISDLAGKLLTKTLRVRRRVVVGVVDAQTDERQHALGLGIVGVRLVPFLGRLLDQAVDLGLEVFGQGIALL